MQITSNEKVIKDNNTIKTKISDVSAVLNRIGEQYEQQQKEIKKLKNTIANFQAEVYKDQEMKEMRKDYNAMRNAYLRGFPISESTKDKIRDWIKDHEDKHHGGYPRYHGVSGGGYIYQFCPTAIGTSGEIFCSSCRRKAFKQSLGDKNDYQDLLNEYEAAFTFQDLG